MVHECREAEERRAQVHTSTGRPGISPSASKCREIMGLCKQRLMEGMARCAGRLGGSLPQQLVIFPTVFSSDFACGNLARKIANDNNIIAGHYNSCNFKDQLQL